MPVHVVWLWYNACAFLESKQLSAESVVIMPTFLLRYLLCVCLVFALGWFTLFSVASASGLQAPVPSFEPAACMFDLPAGLDLDSIKCGYLVVPEDYQNPTGATIRLGVAIIPSDVADVAPDPLILLQGGPGGSTIDTYAEILAGDNQIAPNRDLILFDQRGTLYAEPVLSCPEVFDLTIETLDQDLTYAEGDRLFREAMQACRTRLVAEGIDLSAYDSFQNAADVAALREALGYDQVNLYGVSYGTTLALHTMRNHPAGIRSVILDAVSPPSMNFLNDVARSQDRAFSELFQACANDLACNSAYPDLENIFFDLVDQLNAAPASIRMTDQETGMTYDALLDGDALFDGIFQMLYSSEILPALPKIIYDAHNGTYDALSRILSLVVLDRSMSYGMYFSVVCAEDADFDLDDLNVDGVRPFIAESGRLDAESLLDTCTLWNVESLGSQADQPVVSDIPTLVLSGNFDPITPPAYGQIAADTLPQSYVYTFPNTAHGAALSDDCPNQIIRDFLDDPTIAPDAGCITTLAPPDFITPADVLPMPMLLRLANLEGNTGVELMLFVSGLLLLLSALLIFPLNWLIRKLRRQPVQPQPWLARLAPWLAVLNGVLLLVFTVGLIVLLVASAESAGVVLLFGVPRSWSPLFVLPLVSGLLTLMMLVATVQVWMGAYWSILRRVFYSLVTVAAVVCVTLLMSWGMVRVL